MKRLALILSLLTLIFSWSIPLLAAESFEDFQPIQTGMKLKFKYIIAHVEQKNSFWNVEIVKNSFPESITFKWVRPLKEKSDRSGTRILTDLQLSRDFNPFFINDESKATKDTAPWLSIQVLKELRERNEASNFREGGSGAINWAATTLRVKEKVVFPVIINGKAEALHALRLSKGIVVWNNLKNPLVLEYEPLAVPFFTSVTGWKLVSIEY